MEFSDNISRHDIDFLSTNDSHQHITKWMMFCKELHVNRLNLTRFGWSSDYYEKLLSHASEHDCFNKHELIHVIYWISIITSICIIISNMFIIIIFLKNKHLLTITNILMLSLAFSDILIGIIFLYISIWNHILLQSKFQLDVTHYSFYSIKRSNFYLCMIFDGPVLMFCSLMSSLLSLTLIALDRFIAVVHTYRYHIILNEKRTVIVVIITWIVSFLAGILPTFRNTYKGVCQLTHLIDYDYTLFWSSACFITAAGILYMYVRILRVAYRHNRRINIQQNATKQIRCKNKTSRETTESSRKSVSASLSTNINPAFLADKQEEIKSESSVMSFTVAETSSKSSLPDFDDNRSQKSSQSSRKSVSASLSPNINPAFLEDKQEEIKSESSAMSFIVEETSSLREINDNRSLIFSQSSTQTSASVNMSQAFEEQPVQVEQLFQTPQDIETGFKITSTNKQASSGVMKSNTAQKKPKSIIKSFHENHPSFKAIKTAGIILGSFYICWMPFLIYLLAYHGHYNADYVYCLAVITQFNSLLNPLIYGFRQNEVRQAGAKLLNFTRNFN
ncbi:hypothetical protein SNE40_016983 [Patella caerulea]|uniref:G-protein coupled receptors family 1 profile domain-containing protein n=1 Tax=Patella caerulea TaxID=87958 RepID=A0AAN8JCS3_PATCE